MNAPKDQIWNLLQTSGLLSPAQIEKAQSEFLKAVKNPDRSKDGSNIRSEIDLEEHEKLLDWLRDAKLISRLHREVMGSGSVGPFNYGDYLLLENIDSNGAKTDWHRVKYLARDIRTGHLVELEFFSGQDENDSRHWDMLFQWAERRRAIEHPHIAAVYQAIALPNHRFLVREKSNGTPFLEKLPLKSRLPWEKACLFVGQVSEALRELHQRELVHENLWPGNIHIKPDGSAIVELDWEANLKLEGHPSIEKERESALRYKTDDALDEQADWYSLGCVLYRLVSGKPPTWTDAEDSRKSKIASLTKLEVPKEVQKLINYLTSTNSEKPVKSEKVLGYLRKLCKREAFLGSTSGRPQTHQRLVDHIKRELPPSELPKIGPDPVVAIEVDEEIASLNTLSLSGTKTPIVSSRKRNRNIVNLALAAGTGLLACAIGALLVAFSLGSFSPAAGVAGPNSESPNDLKSGNVENNSTANSATKDANDNSSSAESAQVGWLVQSVVENDADLLWESPTTGFPVDWSGVPVAPDFVFAIRPADILDSENGELVLKSLGPDFNSMLQNWQEIAGVDLEKIEQLIVSLHSDGTSQFRPCFIVRLAEPIETEVLTTVWKAKPENTSLENRQLLVGVEYSYLVTVDNKNITSFMMSRNEFLRGAIERGDSPMSGTMGRLSRLCDGSRHFNVFFVPRILSNEQSQQLFANSIAKLRKPLMLFFDDRVNGVLFSLHQQDDLYWEMQFDRSPDIKSSELKQLLDDRLKSTRDSLNAYVMTLSNHEYWTSVKMRWSQMLQFVYSNSRVGVERDEAIANGWLPIQSAHNLIAASELAISAGVGGESEIVTVEPPRNLAELLERKRALKITSSPDLVNLLRDLQAEIRDDFPDLPFEFEIRLMGADLGEEGITQNQRPSDITMPDNSLAEILTEICFKANPDKNATSPKDELCKLIWVVQKDPDQVDRDIVMITTRKAAITKGFELPKAFLSE